MESMTPAVGPSLDQGGKLVTTKAVRERHKVGVKRQFCTERTVSKRWRRIE